MPKYKIGGSMGYAGTDWQDEIEADNEEQALEIAQDFAYERVEYWAIPIEDSE